MIIGNSLVSIFFLNFVSAATRCSCDMAATSGGACNLDEPAGSGIASST